MADRSYLLLGAASRTLDTRIPPGAAHPAGCWLELGEPAFAAAIGSVSSGPRRGTEPITAQGHPRAIFRRALERGNLLVAETTLRAIGRPTEEELLLLTALICRKQPQRGRRVAARFLERYLQHVSDASIDDAALVATLLAALGGSRHEQALTALLDMVGTASNPDAASGATVGLTDAWRGGSVARHRAGGRRPA